MGTKCLNSLSSVSRSESATHKKRALQQDNLLIEPTGIEKLDSFLEPAKEALDSLIKERKKFKSAYRRFLRATYSHVLSEVTLTDGIIAMLYVYSAGCEGDLTQIGLKIIDESPYFVLDYSALNTYQKAVNNQWNIFLIEMDELIPNLEKIQAELYQVSLTSLPTMMQDSIKSFSEIEQAQISLALSSNIQKVKSASSVIDDLIDLQFSLEKELQAFLKNYDSPLMQQVAEIGRSAFRAQVFEPKKIVMTYWPQEERL